MGIRFDKDTRRATNGPMIFFSDPSAGISLGEEIRGAIDSRLSFYAYRRPGDMMISFGSSEGAEEGIGSPGFVIAGFIPDRPYITIPYKPVKPFGGDIAETYRCPDRSTRREEHQSEIKAIQQALLATGKGKIVAARVSVGNRNVDIAATFFNLLRKHPDAFVFCFATPFTGCWIGASPELLLESTSTGVSTMALAGTRSSHSQGEWDFKNIEEQQMVADFIVEAMRKHDISVITESTFTRQAGKVEHLCTPISGHPDSPLSPEKLSSLLHDLSPTPALCGLPRDMALEVIRTTERFDRGYYGGFCGPYRSPQDFTFFVNLRCCMADADRYAVFTGGGITLRSDASSEWNETEMKASTILESIRFNSLSH